MKSVDLTQKNIEKIAELFPNVITEVRDENGKLKRAVDFDLLKQELSDIVVEGDKERYQLMWPGKKQAILNANTPIDKTLRPVKEDSVDWDNTQNLYIEGDNLEVLKLLQESYLNKIKCIYIDPPYNTGKDFIYKDDFKESTEEYLEESGQVDEEGNRLFQNTESNGRFHSDWLTMMYSRLKIARNLLREDGVIFISIDDNEMSNLRRIADEIFNNSNFIAELVWDLGTGTQAGHFTRSHEYILVYAKNKSKLPNFSGGDGIIEHSALKKIGPKNPASTFEFPKGTRFDAPDGTELTGTWGESEKTTLISGRMISDNGRLKENVILEAGWAMKEQMKSWFSGKETFDSKGQKVIEFYFNRNGILKYKKERSVINPSTVIKDVGSTKVGTEMVKNLLNFSGAFIFPKPINLILFLIRLVTRNGDIILDFFSGSATTAHAVMQLNAEDGGNRKYIMVQLPEPTDENSEAYKAGYKNICEIGKERIRRAAKKIIDETGADIDYGFRVFRVDSSNMKDVYYTPDKLGQGDILNLASNIKEDRTSEDLLIQVMLELGLELSLPMETKQIDGKTVHYVAGNSLVACFEEDVSESLIKKIAEDKPLRVVFRDSSFKDDSARINVEELFKMLSPGTEIQVL